MNMPSIGSRFKKEGVAWIVSSMQQSTGIIVCTKDGVDGEPSSPRDIWVTSFQEMAVMMQMHDDIYPSNPFTFD